MNRRLVAAAWITGAIVPMVTATLFLVGCCVLPFHGVMHKVMPLCHMATSAAHAGHGGSQDPPSPPAREKQEPVKRIASEIPNAFRLTAAGGTRTHAAAPVAATGYRSFISLGAIRCDRDVGLYVLADTFRI
jgi:hypothetical protein